MRRWWHRHRWVNDCWKEREYGRPVIACVRCGEAGYIVPPDG